MMSSSSIIINGLHIEVVNNEIYIDGKRVAKSRLGKYRMSSESQRKQYKTIIDKDGNINGDVIGNIEVSGTNVTLIVKGDITGNITGDCDIKVSGDVIGNIIN